MNNRLRKFGSTAGVVRRGVSAAALAAAVLLCGDALGQAATIGGYERAGIRRLEPLEQLVGDVGPQGISLKRVEPGLSVRNAQESRVFREAGADPQASISDSQRLIYIDQGVNATFDRSQYVATEEGNILQAIPANTMFYLDAPDAYRPVTQRAPGAVRPGQIDGRTGREDRTVSEAQARYQASVERSRRRSEVAAARLTHHRAVLGALDRLIDNKSDTQPAASADTQP